MRFHVKRIKESKIENTLLFILVVVYVLSYFRVPFLFFQQDELLGLGSFMKDGQAAIFNGLGASHIRHFVPVSLSISYQIFKYFGLRYWAYNLVALMFHLLNGVLVYQLGRRIFKKKISSFVAVFVFFSSSVAAELIMWPVININSISLTFSLILWLAIIDERILSFAKGFLRGAMVSILFLLSILSIEYSLGLIVFIPIATLVINRRKAVKKIIELIPFGIVVFGYAFLRAFPILINKGVSSGFSTNGSLVEKIFNLVTRYVGQLFVGQRMALTVSGNIGKIFGQMDKKEVFIENIIYPNVVIGFGILVLIVFILVYKKLKKGDSILSKHLLVIIIFILSASLPFLLIPGPAGAASIISSRYLYFGLAGMALFIGLLLDVYFHSRNSKMKYLVLFVALLLITHGTYENFNKGNDLYEQGRLRSIILSLIKSNYQLLPERVIFYTESDTPYYGLSDETKIMPYQSGFGQTLLVYYYDSENFPKEFYPGNYLWEIDSQGYEEHGGRGFGYFRDIDLLKETMEKYNLTPDSIIALSWKDKTQSLLDISKEVRQNVSR